MEIGKIASVYELKNVIIKNTNSDTQFEKQHILIVEDIKGQRIVLDLNNGNDITGTYMIPMLNKKTKMKLLFENEMFKK